MAPGRVSASIFKEWYLAGIWSRGNSTAGRRGPGARLLTVPTAVPATVSPVLKVALAVKVLTSLESFLARAAMALIPFPLKAMGFPKLIPWLADAAVGAA